MGGGGSPLPPAPPLTLQACASSSAAVSTSLGFSITRPVHPEKSMATSALSDTLRCGDGESGLVAAGGPGGAPHGTGAVLGAGGALTRAVGPIQGGWLSRA